MRSTKGPNLSSSSVFVLPTLTSKKHVKVQPFSTPTNSLTKNTELTTDNPAFFALSTNAQKTRLLLTGILIACGGSFHFGYQTSYINPLANVLQTFLQNSLENHLGLTLKPWALQILWPAVAGLLFVGAFLGAITAPTMMHRWGIKGTFALSTALISMSLLMAAASKWIFCGELFIAHRLLSGIGIGMITTVQTVYLTEISPIRYRGFMGTLTGFSTSIGFVSASCVALPQILGSTELWPWTLLVELIPSLILMVALWRFICDSPIRLLREGREKEAVHALELFHDKSEALKRANEIMHEINTSNMSINCTEIGLIFLWKNSRHALIICMLLNATVSFSGIMAVSFFGTFLLQNIGFSDDGAALANCVASLFGFLGNIVGSSTVDKIGRRLLLIGCLSLLVLLNVCLMTLVFIFQYTDDTRLGYAFLAIHMIFLFVFSVGVGPLAWFLATELSALAQRERLQSVSVSCQYVTCFLSPVVFLPLYHHVGPLSFLILIAPCTFCALYLFVYLPETKNRSIEDIVKDLQARSIRTQWSQKVVKESTF